MTQSGRTALTGQFHYCHHTGRTFWTGFKLPQIKSMFLVVFQAEGWIMAI